MSTSNYKSKLKTFWNSIILRNIFLAVLSAFVLLLFSSVFLDLFTRHGDSSPVPDFVGKSIDSVRIIAANHDLRIEIADSVFRIGFPKGAVFLQNPEAGIHVKKNRKVFVTMNSFSPRKESVPNVKSISLRQAKTVLGARGFRVGRLEYSGRHRYTNHVFEQLYKGKEIEPGILLPVGEYIDLRLGLDSAEHSPFIVPNVVGQTKQAAEDIIVENSLNYILSFEGKGIKTIVDSLDAVAYKQEPVAGSSSNYGNNVKIWLRLPDKSKKKQ
jgi:beta-lactam-binding protein with PASTA domain